MQRKSADPSPTLAPAVLYLAALAALGALGACSSNPARPGHADAAWPADSLSLDYITVQSDWVGQVRVKPVAAGSQPRRAEVAWQDPWLDFPTLDSAVLPWPQSSPAGREADSGAFLVFLRRKPGGGFETPVFGRTAFKTVLSSSAEGRMEFVPFRDAAGYPAFDPQRMDVTAYAATSNAPLFPGIHSPEGVWKAAFRKYVTESRILWTLFLNDSAQSGFLDRHASFQSNHGRIMLHYLAGSGMRDRFGAFIAQGNYVDFSDRSNMTPLMVCMVNGDFKSMDTLLAYGANVNLITPDDSIMWTPIHVAVNMDKPDVAVWLRANGAGIHFADELGMRPIHKAACRDSVLEVIAFANDSLAAVDKRGRTALDLARECGKAKNVAFLEAALANPTSQVGSPGGKSTPRGLAMADGHHQGGKLLALGSRRLHEGAAQAMADLVELECALKTLRYGIPSPAGAKACRTLVGAAVAVPGVGAAIAGDLGAEFSEPERDSIMGNFIQASYGKPMPLALSDRLDRGSARLLAMRREFSRMVMSAILESLAEAAE